jgi:hypothetical protein
MTITLAKDILVSASQPALIPQLTQGDFPQEKVKSRWPPKMRAFQERIFAQEP